MNILRLLRRHRVRPSTAGQERFEIAVTGSGGQGVILSGKILAEAAALYDKKEAVMTQSYGPEARGGASKAEIIISPAKIEYPKIMDLDVLLVMTQEAMDKYGGMLEPDDLLIVDETFVKKVPQGIKNVFSAPFTATSIKKFNMPIIANVIALGALVAITKVISRESLIQAVVNLVSESMLVWDRVAVDAGFKVVKDSGFKWERITLKN